jgi:hypothetical protein
MRDPPVSCRFPCWARLSPRCRRMAATRFTLKALSGPRVSVSTSARLPTVLPTPPHLASRASVPTTLSELPHRRRRPPARAEQCRTPSSATSPPASTCRSPRRRHRRTSSSTPLAELRRRLYRATAPCGRSGCALRPPCTLGRCRSGGGPRAQCRPPRRPDGPRSLGP